MAFRSFFVKGFVIDMSEKSLKVDIIENGIVIDHIKAGNSVKIYNYLNLAGLDCVVAIIKNVKSKKHGLKDLIKIESTMNIDLDVLGYLDSDATINIIKNGKIIDKKCLVMPKRIKNVVKCKNPRCISSIEQELEHVFEIPDELSEVYRCVYCQQEASRTESRTLFE